MCVHPSTSLHADAPKPVKWYYKDDMLSYLQEVLDCTMASVLCTCQVDTLETDAEGTHWQLQG
jgi:hypothetical protein